MLAQLANGSDEFVRSAVAANLDTSVDVLKRLANDEEWFVRRCVADNPNTPADVLVQLANDEVADVRESAVQNPNCPASLKKSKTSKKSKKSNNSNDWPSADEWYDAFDEAFENMWGSYLAGPEDEVNKEL